MTAQKPYSPETLADRWGCSAEKVRLMYRSGELPGFRLGKLIRIPANEVERYECQNTPSPDIAENGLSLGENQADRTREESRLARLTNDRPKPSGEKFGNASRQQRATG